MTAAAAATLGRRAAIFSGEREGETGMLRRSTAAGRCGNAARILVRGLGFRV